MRPTLRPVLEILPPSQRDVWAHLGPLQEEGFVLYGGTAVALRLGHRTSIDFDFFTERPLPREPLAKSWLVSSGKILKEETNSLTVVTNPRQSGNPGVKVSLFGGVQMGRVGVPACTEDGLVCVASLLDLLATKLKVILQRAEAKDYQDIAKILETGLPLARGLGAARALFSHEFPTAECLRALTFFGDGDLETLGLREKAILVESVRKTPNHESVPKVSESLMDRGRPGDDEPHPKF